MTLAIVARIGCPSPLLRPIRKPLTLARLPAILRPMRFASRTVALLRTALCTHRDLLFEILALRHQRGGLSRSHRRFRTSDRLFWLCLRRVWPGWREALVLVQPATVDRWHREGFRGWWRRHSRRQSGRPRIDSQLRPSCSAAVMRRAARVYSVGGGRWASCAPTDVAWRVCRAGSPSPLHTHTVQIWQGPAVVVSRRTPYQRCHRTR